MKGMNKWVQESIKIANDQDYLYKLSVIYPSIPLPRRPLNSTIRHRIKSLHEERKGLELFKLLLEIKKRGHPFPIEHPYVTLLGRRELFEKNQKLAEQIGQILLSMSVEDIVRGCERPPLPSLL